MAEHKDNEEYRNEVQKRFKRLSRFIQGMKDSDEKRASLAFCVANLIVENCDEIEGLGLLEKVKSLLEDTNRTPNPPTKVTTLPYIS